MRRVLARVVGFVDERTTRWRTGTNEGQLAALAALSALALGMIFISLASYDFVPVATLVIPLVLGSFVLRYRPLLVLLAIVGLGAVLTVTKQSIDTEFTSARISNLLTVIVVGLLILFAASRYRSGLPGPLGEAMLVELNDRLQSQGVVPSLPEGWRSQSAVLSAGGAKFAGDFLVANLSEDQKRLEMVLVDVCGKGVGAGTQSLQFAGALGGLIGSLPPLGLFAAANDFLLRQRWDEGFATAVHVLVHLDTGTYSVINAGHPPALRWSHHESVWGVDGARGTALGILERPDFHRSVGTLEPGDALMFYTDGVVESRIRDVRSGIDWLRGRAGQVVLKDGFENAPRRILGDVLAQDDDRAILILDRKLPVVDYARGRGN